MRDKKTYIEYGQAVELIKGYVLPVATKLDYQISYKDIHVDLPSNTPGKLMKINGKVGIISLKRANKDK